MNRTRKRFWSAWNILNSTLHSSFPSKIRPLSPARENSAERNLVFYFIFRKKKNIIEKRKYSAFSESSCEANYFFRATVFERISAIRSTGPRWRKMEFHTRESLIRRETGGPRREIKYAWFNEKVGRELSNRYSDDRTKYLNKYFVKWYGKLWRYLFKRPRPTV